MMDHLSMICSYNSNHILNDPKRLPCAKLACHTCLNRLASYNGKLKCKFCKQEHDLKNDDILCKDDVSISVEKNLISLCDYMKNNVYEVIEKIESRKLDFDKSFDNYIDFIGGEIELRIESLHIDLDALDEKLCKNLEGLHQKYILRLSLLKEAVDVAITLKYVKKIKKLTRKIIKFETTIFDFKAMNCILNAPDFIGSFKRTYLNMNKFNSAEPIIIDLNGKVQSLCALCALNDKQMLVSDFKRNELYIFDKNFDKFERISHVQSFKIRSFYGICTSDDYQNIYLCDLEYSRILISNSDFTLIKKIILKAGSTIDEFFCARDVCFYSDLLFVLDQAHKSVFIFNKYGEFIKMFELIDKNKISIELNEEIYIQNPVGISAGDDIIVVIDWKKSVFVYNFNGYLVNVIRHLQITSFCLKDEWLIIHSEDGRIACYMQVSGTKFDFKKVSDRYFKTLKYRSESLTLFNNRIVISMGWAKMLAIIMVT